MPDRQEIFASLYGAWRLACFDENGMSHFNVSVEGFWRSFFAAVILTPFYMFSIGPSFMTPEGDFSFWAAVVHFIFYAMGWVLFPLVAFFATDLLQIGHRFTALIVAVNWSAVLIAGISMLFGVVLVLIQGELAYFIGIAVGSGVIVYHWFVIKTALGTTTPTAIAFALFNLVLSYMLVETAKRIV